MAIKNYQDLDVWNKSMDLAVILYSLSREFPAEERLGLPQQITEISGFDTFEHSGRLGSEFNEGLYPVLGYSKGFFI